MSLCRSRSPTHHASSDDGSLLLAADACTERVGAKPSRAVVARGLRHTVLTHEDSAIFGTQQEAKKNYLVTMTGTASSSTPCPVRPFLCQSDPERLPARSGEIWDGLFAGGFTSGGKEGQPDLRDLLLLRLEENRADQAVPHSSLHSSPILHAYLASERNMKWRRSRKN